jgi:glycosyltransferase involved in cell wall biosynthesis/SAM-dependent methyltransferase
MDRVRVLWLIKGLGPGGAETLLAASAAARDRDHFDYATAFVVPEKQALVPALEEAGVEVTCLGARGRAELRWPWRLRRRLVEQPVDIVHAHSPLVAAGARIVARTLPRQARPVTVSTEHNIWPAYAVSTRILNAVTYPLDRAHFAVSDQVRRSIPAWWQRRTETLVHGIAVDEVRAHRSQRERMRAELGVAPDECLAVTVANYRVHKDYPTLLAAARMVRDQGLPVRFVAVGQGPLERDVHEEHARSGLGEDFRLLGYRPDALDILAAADLLVLSSRQEGLPVALMEALTLGLPVVATAVGGISEAVTHGVEGLLVPPARPEELACAIAELARDPRLRARLSNASASSAAQFDVRPSIRRYEDRYRLLVRQPVGTDGPRLGRATDRRTVAGFGYEWTRFDQSPRSEDELRATFSQYFAVFPWSVLPPNSAGVDVGCGTGRWARFAAERAQTMYCIDPSLETLRVAGRLLRDTTNCSFVAAAAGELSFRRDAMDFGYSLGVLHHTPDPLRVLRDAVSTLKPGAPFLVYLYYALDNRPAWFRAAWRVSDLARRAVSTLPSSLRYAFSQVVAGLVYYPLARAALLLERTGRDVARLPLSAYRHRSFYAMRTDALDRFGTRLERRFTAAEVRELMEQAGLERIVISPSAPYWCAVGYRRGET